MPLPDEQPSDFLDSVAGFASLGSFGASVSGDESASGMDTDRGYLGSDEEGPPSEWHLGMSDIEEATASELMREIDPELVRRASAAFDEIDVEPSPEPPPGGILIQGKGKGGGDGGFAGILLAGAAAFQILAWMA